MSKNNFLKQKVPTHLAFIIMLGLSLLVACIAIHIGEVIVRNAKQSPTFNFQKKLSQENIQLKNEEVKKQKIIK